MARFDFEGEHSDELSFSEGDVIQLKAYVGQDWARGQMGTSIGIFPLNFVEVIEDLPPPPNQQQPNKLPEATKPAEVSRLYKQRGWRVATPHVVPVLFYQQLCHLPWLLRPVWSGWWLSTTLLEIPKETCRSSREITFFSAATLILGGAAVGSTAERAFSPGLLFRAQVRAPCQSYVETGICEIL